MRLFPHWKPGLAWLAFLAPFFFLSYGFANAMAAARANVPSIMFEWEHWIPVVPWMILPYWSIDLFYGSSLLMARTRLQLSRHARRLLTAQVVCIGSFLLFPLQLARARPEVDGWAGTLFNALVSFDLPFNQAPSLHIVLLVIVWDFYRRQVRGWGKALLHFWALLIGVSVLTTYQHHFIDIPTGLLVGALCLWLWPLQGEAPAWQWTRSAARRRLALYYALGALALALLALRFGTVWWWLYWPAVSLGGVALCYAALGPGGFQKRAGGRHSFASRLLFLPYRLGAWINSRGWTRGLPASVAIDERVWLGRLPSRWDADHARFPTLVDLASELSAGHRGTQSHGWLDLVEPTPEQLRAAAQAVEAATARGPVLVCCALGFSRSSATVATWLCLYGGARSVEEAVARVRAARPQVVLKPPMLLAIAAAVAMPRADAPA